MNELTLAIKQNPGTIEMNFDALEEQLDKKLDEYRGAVFTEDTKTIAKAEIASLRRLKKDIEDGRKTVKKKWMEPYDAFDKRISSNDNKRYPGKYPYRYANGMTSNYIINPHFTDSNFQLIIYGPVVNPQVTIGSTPYLVNIVLESGEYLLIDSRSETIAKVINNGERINVFHNRQKGRKFFRKIQPGRQTISWTGKFDFDLIIFEERGEPRWQDLQ